MVESHQAKSAAIGYYKHNNNFTNMFSNGCTSSIVYNYVSAYIIDT